MAFKFHITLYFLIFISFAICQQNFRYPINSNQAATVNQYQNSQRNGFGNQNQPTQQQYYNSNTQQYSNSQSNGLQANQVVGINQNQNLQQNGFNYSQNQVNPQQYNPQYQYQNLQQNGFNYSQNQVNPNPQQYNPQSQQYYNSLNQQQPNQNTQQYSASLNTRFGNNSPQQYNQYYQNPSTSGNARIISHYYELQPDGSYQFNYETNNGITVYEDGSLKESNGGYGPSVQGGYSYTAPNGLLVTVKYIADGNGYHPQTSFSRHN